MNQITEYSVMIVAGLWSYFQFGTKQSEGIANDSRGFIYLIAFIAIGIVLFSLYQWLYEMLVPAFQKIEYVKANNGGYAKPLNFSSLRNTFPLGHSTQVAGLIVLLFPWLIQATIESSRLLRILFGASVALAALTVFSTSSRAGLLCISVIFGIYGVLVILHLLRSTKNRIIVGSLLMVLLLGLMSANPRIQESIASVFSGSIFTESDSQRGWMFRTGMEMLFANPWFGVGTGMIPSEYPQYCPNTLNGIFTARQLHNSPIHIAVETGCVGVFLFFSWIAYPFLKTIKRRCIGQGNLGKTAIISIIGYGVFSLFDYHLDFVVFPLLLGIFLGLILSPEAKDNFDSKTTPKLSFKIPIIGIAIISTILVLLTIPDVRARYHWKKAVDNFYAGDFENYASSAKTAAVANPYDPYYSLDLALRSLHADRSVNKSGQDTSLTQTIQSLEDLSLKLPTQEIVLYNLAWSMIRQNPRQALSTFWAANRVAESKEYLWLGIAICYERMGIEQSAIQALAIETMLTPSFLSDQVWQTGNFEKLKPKVIQQVKSWISEAEVEVSESNWGLWILELLDIYSPEPLPQIGDLRTPILKKFVERMVSHENSDSSNSETSIHIQLVKLWKDPQFDFEREYFRSKSKALPPQLSVSLRNTLKKSDIFPLRELLELNSDEIKNWFFADRITRPGLPFVLDHPEMPLPGDIIPIVRNGIVMECMKPLFPPRTMVPIEFIREHANSIEKQ